jgi:hypothetical protein
LSPDDGWIDPVEPPIPGLSAASQPADEQRDVDMNEPGTESAPSEE